MPKPGPEAAPRLPTREQIRAFVEQSPGPVGRRDIARAFAVKGQDRTGLKRLLRALAEDGEIDLKRGRERPAPGRLPPVGVVEILSVDDDGEAVARPVSGVVEDERATVVLPHSGRGPAFAAGDRVLARLSRLDGDVWRGAAMRRLESGARRAIGVLERAAGGLRLRPADGRRSEEAAIEPGGEGGAAAGDLVAAELFPRGRFGLRRARVVEVLARRGAARPVSLLCIHERDIPHRFPAEALALADRAAPVGPGGGRTDLRDTPLVTIDGADARDFDDAVWAEPDGAPDNPGGWRLLVAIADVAHYVRPGDALDAEARKRGNSVYFPDRVVPMLPEALSNGLCSLRPGEDRACLAVEMRIDAAGRKRSHRFLHGVMRSAARVTYEEMQAARDGDGGAAASGLAELARPLYGAFGALLAARRARGALEIEMPEMAVALDGAGRVASIEPRARLDSHRLIEEFMVLANVAAAETLERRRRACAYRVHDAPDAEKVEELRRSLETLGIPFPRGQALRPALFNRALERARGADFQDAVNILVLRTQSQAVYSPFNIGHFGLGLRRYAHFTSPIRRYADLLVHRALIEAHGFDDDDGGGGDGGGGRPEPADLAEVCEHVSMTERRAAAAERDAMDRHAAAYMAGRIGEAFEAVVSGVARFGAFVSLDGGRAEALLPASSLPGGRYRHDPERHELASGPGGLRLRLGQRLTVALREADPLSGKLLADYIGGGEAAGPGSGRRGGAGRPASPGPRRRRGRSRG